MLGDNQNILGSVGENARTIQEEKQGSQKKIQDKVDTASAPQDALAKDGVTITPQLAQGLVKSTGDESWLRATGTRMRSDIYSSLLTMGSKKKLADRIVSTDAGTFLLNEDTGQFQKIGEGKINKMDGYMNGKHRRGVVSYDDDGKPSWTPLDEGIDPAKEHPSKSTSGKGASEDPKDKEFVKTYRKALADTQGMSGTVLSSLAKSDPARAKEMQEKMAFVQKYKKRFDDLQGTKTDQTEKPTYASPQDVAEAMKSGKITREEAEKVLQDQFNMQ